MRSKIVTLGILCLIATFGGALAVLGSRSEKAVIPPINLHSISGSTGVLVAQRGPRREPVQVISFAIYDVGISPQQTYARPGLVAIAIEDLSGRSSRLIVERQLGGGNRLLTGEVHPRANSRHGREEWRLAAGRYELYLTDRPEHRAALIVEP